MLDPAAARDPADADTEVGAARQLLAQGRFAAAIAELQSALRRTPGDQQALYLLAVCHRYCGDSQLALAIQDELLRRHPKYARGHQERAHLLRSLNRTHEALAAYEQAIALNPGLLSSWQELATLYRNQGSVARAQACQTQIKTLTGLPRELLSVTSMIHEGELVPAEKICRAFLQRHPRQVEAMRLLAKIATEVGVLDEAEFLLESALAFAPDFRAARYDYAQVLQRRQRFQKAREQTDVLLEQEPDNPAFQLVCANAAAELGEFDRALACYERLIALHPSNPQLHLLKGHALKSHGEPQRAVAAYRAAAQIKPDHGDAYWSLANIKTYRFDTDEVIRMQRTEADAATASIDRYQLCFALGKSFEDAAEYELAFNYYTRGNRLKLTESGYRSERVEQEFAQQQALCTREFFQQRAGYGVSSNTPIFIVGLPRSGSTLLEQILASHSLVDGTIELPNIIALTQRLDGRKASGQSRYPAILATLEREQCERFGNDYLESTQVYRRGAPFFTDKTPNNFRHLGLIHLLFPNARIVDARREPMACCFSNFKQLFGEGHYFSYGLEEIGRYYRGYVGLMNHWEQVLPGKILRVHYEDVVADLEQQVRRLLDFLELPFEPGCLDFHRNRRAVHTPSAEQVRQPIYRDGLEQWQHFEPFLEPLKHALAG